MQTRGRVQDVPYGEILLCLPMNGLAQQSPTPMEAGEKPDTAPVSALLSRFVRSLAAAYRDLGRPRAYTPEHCRKLERLLRQMMLQIRACIARLGKPEYLQDQRMLSRLRPLHRTLVESLVVVRSVCGLCAEGRHVSEPTGAYWQLVEYVRSLQRDCQIIARLQTPGSDATTFQRASA